MAGKRKGLTVVAEMAPPVRHSKPRIAAGREPTMSPEEVDQRWEQIRIRGEQIRADIDALLARVSAHTP